MASGRGRACSSSSILPSRPTAAHVRMTADFSLAPVIVSRMLRIFSALMSSPLVVSSLSSLLCISPYMSTVQPCRGRHIAAQVCVATPELELRSHSLQLGVGNDVGELESGLQNLGASGSNAKMIQESPVWPRLDHQLHDRLPMRAGGGGLKLVRLEDGPLCRKLHHCQKIRQTLLCVWLGWLPGYNCPPRTVVRGFFHQSLFGHFLRIFTQISFTHFRVFLPGRRRKLPTSIQQLFYTYFPPGRISTYR